MTEQNKFDQWAIVEVMGHRTYAGRVFDETIAGKGFLRIDVPETPTTQAWTKLLGVDSIYAITPCSEQTARQSAGRLHATPHHLVHSVDSRPLLERSEPDFPSDEEEDWHP